MVSAEDPTWWSGGHLETEREAVSIADHGARGHQTTESNAGADGLVTRGAQLLRSPVVDQVGIDVAEVQEEECSGDHS